MYGLYILPFSCDIIFIYFVRVILLFYNCLRPASDESKNTELQKSYDITNASLFLIHSWMNISCYRLVN